MNLQRRETLMAVVAIVCFVSFVGDRLILTPAIEGWKERAAAIDKLEGDVTKGQKLLEQEDNFRRKWKEMEPLAFTENSAEAESKLLALVDQWGKNSGLQLKDLKPRIRKDNKNGDRMELTALGEGGMKEIAGFLFELETFKEAALALENVEITSKDDRGALLTLNVRISGPLGIKVIEKNTVTRAKSVTAESGNKE
jgi:Tfp pilus assembly protein PilO